jgi:hypothetical protein
MPLTLTEKLDSRKWTTGDNASVEMVYILTGTSDDLTAKDVEGLQQDVKNNKPAFV